VSDRIIKQIPQFFLGRKVGPRSRRKLPMRFGHALFIATTAGLLTLAAPTLARNADAQQSGQRPTASCHAYQMAADGSWTELPCQETGSTAQTQHKPAPKGTDDETH
jgi:hypothetical protein